MLLLRQNMYVRRQKVREQPMTLPKHLTLQLPGISQGLASLYRGINLFYDSILYKLLPLDKANRENLKGCCRDQ